MTHGTEPYDFLFVSEKPFWPLDQGFCIRGYHMALALGQLGRRVAVSCIESLPSDAPAALRQLYVPWPVPQQIHVDQFVSAWKGPGVWVRKRLARFQGLDPVRLAGVVPLVARYRPRAVVGLGQHSPMMLAGLKDNPDIRRLWYAADELLRFQFSCMRREPFGVLPQRLLKLGLYAALEAFFVRGLDAAIGVNPVDAFLLRQVAGAQRSVTIRNGVDLDYFNPSIEKSRPVRPRSLVIWGRMDFEPNIDAVTWFARHVWPRLRQRRPDATWQIIGKNPSPTVKQLSQVPGVSVLGQVADIRPHAQSASVVILPIRCGGGIKNKLLEAAAMGRPIVASPKALHGLSFEREQRPVMSCQSPQQWVQMIMRLWSDTQLSSQLGRQALGWVQKHHTWQGAAGQFMQWFDSWSRSAGPVVSSPSVDSGVGRVDAHGGADNRWSGNRWGGGQGIERASLTKEAA